MKIRRKRSIGAVCAACLLCAGMVVGPLSGPAGWAQPPGPFADPGALHRQLIGQLVEAWSEVAQRVAQDPMFLESPEAEPLMMRAETLGMISRQMMAALRPAEAGPGPAENGRFQFVEWIAPQATYWVLDTRTGEMHPREAPPLEP